MGTPERLREVKQQLDQCWSVAGSKSRSVERVWSE
jgi:hypothetical protein